MIAYVEDPMLIGQLSIRVFDGCLQSGETKSSAGAHAIAVPRSMTRWRFTVEVAFSRSEKSLPIRHRTIPEASS